MEKETRIELQLYTRHPEECTEGSKGRAVVIRKKTHAEAVCRGGEKRREVFRRWVSQPGEITFVDGHAGRQANDAKFCFSKGTTRAGGDATVTQRYLH